MKIIYLTGALDDLRLIWFTLPCSKLESCMQQVYNQTEYLLYVDFSSRLHKHVTIHRYLFTKGNPMPTTAIGNNSEISFHTLWINLVVGSNITAELHLASVYSRPLLYMTFYRSYSCGNEWWANNTKRKSQFQCLHLQ